MFSNPRTLKWTGIGAAVVVVGILLYLRISAIKPEGYKEKDNAKSEDPLEKARATLRRSGDLNSCRTALQHLNALLSQKKDVKFPTLSTEERDRLRSEAGLKSDDLAELEQNGFTLLDGIHLETALLFRDASRSLIPKQEGVTRTPEEEAAVLFAWTVRQVPIVEGFNFVGGEPILPPQLGLRRGIGSPMTRALVFLALLEQRGHDGCLLTYPGSGGKTPRYWACGVRGTGERIYLFDPVLGLPLPGSDGKGIATLDALSAKNSTLLTPFDVGPEQKLEYAAETAAGAEVHLVAPLSSLAPRMIYLEKEVLDVAGGGRVHDDLTKTDRFRVALKKVDHNGTVTLAPWAVRMQRSFFPSGEGGIAPPQIMKQFRDELLGQNFHPFRNAVPGSIRTKFDELPHSKRFIEVYATRLQDFFLGSGQPRDLQLRGDFSEATRALGTAFDQMQITLDTFRTNYDPEQVVQWYDAAFAATAGRASASLPRGADKMVVLMVEGASAESLLPHVSYLRALVKHEQAERLQVRLGETQNLTRREEVRELELLWKDARDVWDDYLFRNTFNILPEVTRQARFLQARGQHQLAESVRAQVRLADEAAKPALEEQTQTETKKAIGYWEDLVKDRKSAASLGYRYLAKQLMRADPR